MVDYSLMNVSFRQRHFSTEGKYPIPTKAHKRSVVNIFPSVHLSLSYNELKSKNVAWDYT